jgi:hypothetical protein
MHYDTSKLVGFDEGVENFYLEHEFVYDSRRPGKYQSKAFDSTGWLASAHVGFTSGLTGDPSEFFTYGGEVQRYIDLYDGSRVLVLRALFESVAGTNGRTDGKISFIDLPRLGGSEYLRGYPNGRFRDRSIALGRHVERGTGLRFRRRHELAVLHPWGLPSHTAAAVLEVDTLADPEGEARRSDPATLAIYGRRIAGATPNETTSASESNSSPKALVVPVIRAMRPSSMSSTNAKPMNSAAVDNSCRIEWTMHAYPQNRFAIVNMLGSR